MLCRFLFEIYNRVAQNKSSEYYSTCCNKVYVPRNGIAENSPSKFQNPHHREGHVLFPLSSFQVRNLLSRNSDTAPFCSSIYVQNPFGTRYGAFVGRRNIDNQSFWPFTSACTMKTTRPGNISKNISMLDSSESERSPVKEQKEESSKDKDKGKGKGKWNQGLSTLLVVSYLYEPQA
ncbi:MAG: hypothetical protein WAM26_17070 [Nitrososphaeraceae archaeon]